MAQTYRGNAGAGIVPARARVNLSDFLTTATNAHVPARPVPVLGACGSARTATARKVGVFLYCQQHAREWATPLTCLETAEQLLRNYAIDPATKRLVDNLDIFILPSSNPDGAHYSMHNFGQQRKNLTNLVRRRRQGDRRPVRVPSFWTPRVNPVHRSAVRQQRPGLPQRVGRRPQPQQHVRHALRRLHRRVVLVHERGVRRPGRGVRAGDQERALDRGHVRRTSSSRTTSTRSAATSCGRRARTCPTATRATRSTRTSASRSTSSPPATASSTGSRSVRDTAILPERTGPIADVLYSAAGNSADEHWYNRDVIAYSFETGADIFGPTSLSQPAAAGATQIRLATRTGFDTGDEIVIGTGRDRGDEDRRSRWPRRTRRTRSRT